jgi:MFS family permease
MLALLRRRDFGLLWLGGLVSYAGDWVLYAALPYFVYARTGSTIATAGMIAAELTPGILLSSIAGVFVDRWNRKRILVVTNVLEAAAIALLLLVPNGGWIGFVYVATFAQATFAAFETPAEGALLPTLVHEDELVPANALNALNNRIGRLAGLPLGGFLLAYLGLRGVVIADCATFLAAAALIAPIVAPHRARATPEGEAATGEEALSRFGTFWSEWIDGLRLVRRERTIALLFVVLGIATFGGTMLDPLYAAWVRDVLGRGPKVYSWLLTAHALTGVAGTILVGWIGTRLSPRVLMGWSSVLAGALNAVKFAIPSLVLAFGVALPIGVTSVASSVGVETLAQRSVRDEYRGRVFGSLQATIWLLSLAGAAIGGALGEVFGIVAMLEVASALVALSGVVVLRAYAGVDRRGDSAPGD